MLLCEFFKCIGWGMAQIDIFLSSDQQNQSFIIIFFSFEKKKMKRMQSCFFYLCKWECENSMYWSFHSPLLKFSQLWQLPLLRDVEKWKGLIVSANLKRELFFSKNENCIIIYSPYKLFQVVFPFHSTEVSGDQQLFGYPHSLKYLPLCYKVLGPTCQVLVLNQLNLSQRHLLMSLYIFYIFNLMLLLFLYLSCYCIWRGFFYSVL